MLDALLSLPILGYFLMPATTSWSMSLNFLFFYMTWSTLILSHPPLRVEIIATLATRIVFFLVPSTLFLLFDSILPTLSVSIKIQGAAGLPARTGAIRSVKIQKSRPVWYRVVALSIFNICLATVAQVGIELLLTKVLHVRSALRVTTTLPLPLSMAKDVAKGLLLREVLQYCIHRFVLHSQNTIGRRHQRYHHAITAPYSFSSHYDHPMSYLLWRFVPVFLPAMVLQFHLLTYLLILAIVTFEETMTLSGYSVIPGIMLGGMTRRQDRHNESGGVGNYAPWGVVDFMSSTSVGGNVVADAHAEAEKHDLAGKTNAAMEDAKSTAKDSIKALHGRRRSPRKTKHLNAATA